MLKTIFYLIYLHFVRLKNKLKLISKFMTLQTGQQIIMIHILHDVSRTKYNQTMRFENRTQKIIHAICWRS